MKWGVFCKKVDLSSPQGALCTVLVFFILHFTYFFWGGGAHPLPTGLEVPLFRRNLHRALQVFNVCALGQHIAKRRRKCVRTTFLFVTLTNIHRFKKKFSLTDSAISLS